MLSRHTTTTTRPRPGLALTATAASSSGRRAAPAGPPARPGPAAALAPPGAPCRRRRHTSSPAFPGRPRTRAAVVVRAQAQDGAAPPLRVVVTGGTKGIGRALCEAFLAAGDDVVFCSRDRDRVAAAEAELAARATARRGQVAAGFACDVSAPGAATAFAASASQALGGTIDVWINNAGCTTFAPVMEADDAATAAVVATNLLGTLLASKAALRTLASQATGGHLWNMDGAGSDGIATPNFAAYGATKAALTHLHKSLKGELKAAGLAGKVGLHRLSPGMVTTDLLMAGAGKSPASNFFINVLAEAPVDSAAFLVPRVRGVARSPPVLGGDGATVAFLTKPKALGQLAARLVTGARKGKWLPE